MCVITIRGQLGSGAPEIGKMVADSLGYEYVDRQIIAEVAAKLNYPEQKIEQQEMPPATLFRRIKDALEHSYPPVPDTAGLKTTEILLSPSAIPLDDNSYLNGLKSVIEGLAEDKSIVIRGRGSHIILKDRPDTFHILVIAPLATRLKRIMKERKLDEKAAMKAINNFDKSRREFIKRYFKADLEDPMYYSLVINTEQLNYAAAASIIYDAVSK